ncbi:MAG: cysteine sulfinate desulfinase [Ferrovum sp. 37-45-19]|nr:MAG: cysteine sulfinate desulfinase [Ferrovum sp. 21-44-67]OYV94655.1 MAG: cysteine sulfinate desulfinase [Ferrovum sp. 37-45-19]OZB34524.1 MAG: cysteine sulfinate desulfinase [Ferrovum sp. 34-44-207]HQT81470.1 cysteine desulfurase [Ferrovaceae bacterium]HQU06357.1 cysteine desulfurase [Ferrovaceae bacterium]
MFNVNEIRQQFPILKSTVRGKPLVYLDNAATTQKPQSVIDVETHYYDTLNANVHRGVHKLSQDATDAFEKARDIVQGFIGAQHREEVIFTRGATEAINLVASSWGRANLKPGDEILLSQMEHHANIVPWQMIAEQTGAFIKVIPIDETGTLDLTQFEALLSPKTKMLGVTQVSNALGTVNPVQYMIEKAHQVGALVLVDGAQSILHQAVNMVELDCDFFVFSGHKLYGPTGIGVLYGKKHLLNAMPPYQAGGDMIFKVTFEKSTYNHLPYKFEAGTPHIAGAIGLGRAIEFVQSIGLNEIADHEAQLLTYATEQSHLIPQLRIIGQAVNKVSVFSFVMDGVHPHDIGTILDSEGVAIRTGHHCAMPVMDYFKIPATARASLALYNTKEDIDALFAALHRVTEMFLK